MSGKWLGDGMDRREPQKGDRIPMTRGSGERSRCLARRDDRICLVVVE